MTATFPPDPPTSIPFTASSDGQPRAHRIDLQGAVWTDPTFKTGKNSGQLARTPDGRVFFVKSPAAHQSELGVSVFAQALKLRDVALMNTGTAALASELLSGAAGGWGVYDVLAQGRFEVRDCLGFSAPLTFEGWTLLSQHCGAADPEQLGFDTGTLAYLNTLIQNWDSPYLLTRPTNPGNFMFHQGRPVSLDYDEAGAPPLRAPRLWYGDTPDDLQYGQYGKALEQCRELKAALRLTAPRDGEATFARRVRAACREGFLQTLNAHLALDLPALCQMFVQDALSDQPADRPDEVGSNPALQPALERTFGHLKT